MHLCVALAVAVLSLMQTHNNTKFHNPTQQTSVRHQSQAKRPTAKKSYNRTDEAGHQKLPHELRPFGGCAQRDPRQCDSHPYLTMLCFAKHLALHVLTPHRHSYDRQLCLIHEPCDCDSSTTNG